MTTHDDDITELTELLGHTKAAYGDLRHSHAMRRPTARKSPSRVKIYVALAASLVIAVTVVGILSQAPGNAPSIGRQISLRLPAPTAMPTSVKASAFAKLSSVVPKTHLTLGFSTPRRPKLSDD